MKNMYLAHFFIIIRFEDFCILKNITYAGKQSVLSILKKFIYCYLKIDLLNIFCTGFFHNEHLLFYMTYTKLCSHLFIFNFK